MAANKLIVPGFRAAAARAGIKKGQQLDLALITAIRPAAAAGVFTTNRVKAAPVVISRERLRSGRAQALLINSGNANACTGPAGLEAAWESTHWTARYLELPDKLVLPASTGVIGQKLPTERILAALPDLVTRLDPESLSEVAQAIMTTDTFAKTAQVDGYIGNYPITVAGIAKGAGMIHPRMATLLAFILTDAAISPRLLKTYLKAGLGQSFNRISVDGDTSTNDTVIVMASGQTRHQLVDRPDSAAGQAFATLLHQVMADLAVQIVRDGEGAQRCFRVTVEGAVSALEARKAAETVATSPLVKTAITGADANWGRIMAALGRSGARFDPEQVDICFGPHQVVRNGQAVGPAVERAAHELMLTGFFDLTIHLHLGDFSDYYLTCDLTADYVRINAEYRS
ncbi:MAG: bifunctional glutamate N-acetyltransferase/amino-acid acetyltransferase ArgJ [Desulfobacca sp.]|nr:bifunctional glutamate N-acetyltransferase/amino-acid acetyltransferase ArgJ [Desulfobacca sp.]